MVGRTLIAPQPFSILNTLSRDPPSDFQTRDSQRVVLRPGDVRHLSDQLYLTARAPQRRLDDVRPREQSPQLVPEGERRVDVHEFLQAAVPDVRQGARLVRRGGQGAAAVPHVDRRSADQNLVGGIAQGTGFTPTQSGLGGLFYTITKPASTLKPERTNELEGGIDIGFWGEKADLSATWYKSRTTDVILRDADRAVDGLLAVKRRTPAVFRNSGTELSLNLRPLTTDELSVGRRLRLGTQPLGSSSASRAPTSCSPATSLIGTVAKVGQPLGVIRGLGWIRCGVSRRRDYRAGSTLDAACAGAPKGALYIDDGTHCDGCSNAGMPCGDLDNQRILGDPNPKWTGNAHTSFRFKKLELSTLLDVRHGRRDVERHEGRAVELRHVRRHGGPRHLHRDARTPAAPATCTRSATRIGIRGRWSVRAPAGDSDRRELVSDSGLGAVSVHAASTSRASRTAAS